MNTNHLTRRTVPVALSSLIILSLLQGCGQAEVAPPPLPVSSNSDAVGHYCMMGLAEHEGPKAQIHLSEMTDPIWFTQVRDAIAFLRSPEETDTVTAVYVNDMGKALSWRDPGIDNWISADSAQFVIDSAIRGGMGAPEAIPFGTVIDADAFISENGGTRVALVDVPDDYVLSAVQIYLDAQDARHE